jgi:hypothetical protein
LPEQALWPCDPHPAFLSARGREHAVPLARFRM